MRPNPDEPSRTRKAPGRRSRAEPERLSQPHWEHPCGGVELPPASKRIVKVNVGDIWSELLGATSLVPRVAPFEEPGNALFARHAVAQGP